MSEHEKRLREALKRFHGMTPEDVERAAETFLAEHRAEVEALRKVISVTRDAALEEAAREGRAAVLSWFIGKGPDGDCPGWVHERISALQTQPVAVVRKDEVREEAAKALRLSGQSDQWRIGVAALADAVGANVDDVLNEVLGVDLDATGRRAGSATSLARRARTAAPRPHPARWHARQTGCCPSGGSHEGPEPRRAPRHGGAQGHARG